jgi:hypothetical protein
MHLLDQPAQDFARGTAQLHERQAGEAHDDEEAVKRYAVLGAVTQYLRRATFESQPVQATGGAVSVGVASTEDRGHHQGVDNVRENRDAHVGHRDDIGRRSGRLHTSLLNLGERWVVVGKDDAGAEGAHDEEETETPVDSLECVLNVDARALGFGGHHRDVLGSDDTESGCRVLVNVATTEFFFVPMGRGRAYPYNTTRGSLAAPHACQKSFESAQGSTGKIFCKGAGVVPVPKSVGIARRVASHHGDEGKGEEDEDQDDLACVLC